jgi:type IV pilus assembly protein PilM
MFERIVTGLDLGSYSAKLVELKVGLRGVAVSRCAEWVYPQGATAQEIEAGLRLELARENFANEMVVTAIAGSRLTQRRLRFPFAGKQVASAIALEIAEDLPVPLESMVLTHHERVKTIGGEKRTEVLAILAPREEVREHLAACSRIGVDPSVVEAAGCTLFNAIDFLQAADAPKLMLDIGHSSSNITLVIDGSPVLLRSIPIAGRHLTDAIAADLGLDPTAAEKHKHETGVFRPGTNEPSTPRIEAILDQLARETLRSVQAHVADTLDSEAPSEILLCGGSASLAGLASYLQERTRLPTRTALPPRETPGASELLEQMQPERYVPALALALRGSKSRTSQRGNFRQGHYRYTADLSGLRTDLQRATALFGLLLLLWPLTHAAELFAASRRASALQASIAKLHEEALPGVPVPDDPLAGIEKQWAATEQLAVHLGVTGGGTSPLDLLREISSSLPAELDVSLEELRIEAKSIKARGVTQDFRSVDRVKEELSKIAAFKEVTAANIQNRQRAAGVTFDLTIDLAGPQP